MDITEGPLNKGPETQELELILQHIAIEPNENMNMRYDESLGYILQFGKAPEIYLSELLRLANFNHITLSEQNVALLGDKIEALSQDFASKKMSSDNRIIQKLPDAAKRAIAYYLGNGYYNINRLFRGVAQTKEEPYAGLKPVHAPEGVSSFHKAETTRTKLENSSLTRPIINQVEGEILVPQGTTHLYTTTKGGFFAREVNSPGILPHGGFWSSTAVAQAHQTHLIHPYKDSSDKTTSIIKPYTDPIMAWRIPIESCCTSMSSSITLHTMLKMKRFNYFANI